MHAKRLRLTGPWMGRYNYVSRAKPPVAFNAMLIDDEGDLSGETIEPNSFGAPEVVLGLDSLIAGIIGVREGRNLRFRKTYSDFSAARIDYVGEVDAKFTRVTGRWSFTHDAGEHGTFVLIRDAVGADVARRRARLAGMAELR